MPTLHHVAISVADLPASIEFYEFLGFRTVFTWNAEDRSLTLVHMVEEAGQLLELVHYAEHRSTEWPPVGNDLRQIGVKHLALRTDDLPGLHTALVARGINEITDIQHGRTRFDLFFVRDPDGFWVEMLDDRRRLDPATPIVVEESPRLLKGE